VPDLWLGGGYLQLSVGKRARRRVCAAYAATGFNLVNPQGYCCMSVGDFDPPLWVPQMSAIAEINAGRSILARRLPGFWHYQ